MTSKDIHIVTQTDFNTGLTRLNQQCNRTRTTNKEEKGKSPRFAEIKQTWLAEKLGNSYNMVNSHVQNRQQPRLEVLIEIAEILDGDGNVNFEGLATKSDSFDPLDY